MSTISNIMQQPYAMIKTFALFYLLIFGGYLKSLLTCYENESIKNNKLLIHLIAFILFYFVITLSDESFQTVPPIEKLLMTIIYFLIFLITTRLDLKITLWVIFIIFIIHFIEINKQYFQNKDNNKKNEDQYWITLHFPFEIKLLKVNKSHFDILNNIEKMLYYIMGVLLVIGLIAYGGELKNTLKHSKNLSWKDVFLKRNVCNLNNNSGLMNNFKTGLGIKL